MEAPLVSIGLPTYNGERFLRQTLDSLLGQSFRDFEIVISDNASTDSTEAICREYAEKDSRIRYSRSEQNLGAAWNYNEVFRQARGKYFKWAADDDLCGPEFLSECVEALEQDDEVVLAFPYSVHIDIDGQETEEIRLGLEFDSPAPHERFRSMACHYHDCSAVFGLMRTSVLRNTPLIGSYVASDRALLVELALLGRFVEVPRQLQYRRIHPSDSQRCFRGARQQRAAWFGGGSTVFVFPEWRLLKEYLRSIHVTGLRLQDRLRCYVELLRWVRWGHGVELCRDLGYVLRNAFRRNPSEPHPA